MPPVIAVVAAIGTVGAGMAAVAAGSEIVGGLMIAGGVASGLGAITGNKTLSMIGAVASLGGGLAGLASGTWDTVASSLAQGSSFNPEGTMGALNEGGIDAGGFNPSDIGSSSGAAAGAAGADTSGLLTANMPNVAQGAAQAPQGSMRDALGAGAPDVAQPSATDTTMPTQTPSASGSTPGGAATTPTSTSNFQASGTTDPSAPNAMDVASDKYTAAHYTDQPTQASGSASLWDTLQKLPKWISDNKETAKLASGLVSGAMQSYGQQSLLKQRYTLEDEYLRKQRQRYSDSIVGLHMPTYAPPPQFKAG